MAEVNGPDFSKNELIPAIAQDVATGDVLMMAWMNKESYEETLRTGRVCYYSRSRRKLWRKGEESGNVQELHAIYFDCDGDTAGQGQPNRRCGVSRRIQKLLLSQDRPGDSAVCLEGERVFDPKAGITSSLTLPS